MAGFLFFFDTTLFTSVVEEKKPASKHEEKKKAAEKKPEPLDEDDELVRMEKEFEAEKRKQEIAILAELEDLNDWDTKTKAAEVTPTPTIATTVISTTLTPATTNSTKPSSKITSSSGSTNPKIDSTKTATTPAATSTNSTTTATTTTASTTTTGSSPGAGTTTTTTTGAKTGGGWKFTKPKTLEYDESEMEGVEIWVAMYDYEHFDANAKEFLSFSEGDVFTVLPSPNDLQGWKIAINGQGQKGFVPGNYLQLQTEVQTTTDV